MTQVRRGWFESVPRRFFEFSEEHFAVYVGLGYLLVGVLHFRIWLHSDGVQTLLSNLDFILARPTPRTALFLYSLCGAIQCWLTLRLLSRAVQDQPTRWVDLQERRRAAA